LVTATTANDGTNVVGSLRQILKTHGVRGCWTGSSAVAARQASNWASRQGFTELARPLIKVGGIPGEILAGCVGGTLSAWNTPFEVCRIESQSRAFGGGSDSDGGGRDRSLLETFRRIVDERGVGGLYTGLLPRVGQACYQTVFLVCIPRILAGL
jgi:hypothetical protein